MRCLLLAGALLVGPLTPEIARAQSPVAVPNAMAPHTLAIILIVGAFLAWAASFSLQTKRGRNDAEERKELRTLRESILDRMAELERVREADEIPSAEFEQRRRQLRSELVRVVAKLGGEKLRGKRN
jgi:hypothetical protein